MSEEQKSKIDPADEALLKSAATGEGLVEVTPEGLMELAQMAKDTHDHFMTDIRKLITKERAEEVRILRTGGYSWRAVARECHERFNGTWSPVSNQLAGMALCEVSAEFFGEHYMDEIWN